ncbi:MAG: hypothetical protein II900_00685 [Prevotella sp.]|nr:hypothetical protein [Prevotella sp.]
MKFWYRLIFLPILIFALVGCSDDDDNNGNDNPESTEVEDGKVTQLQKHTVGKGVPIIIMCNRFSDRDIASGKYREAVKWALEGLFSVHPMKSLRDYFDVYEVAAVAYHDNSQDTSTPSYVQNDSIGDVYRYAQKVFGEDRYEDRHNDVVFIVLDHKLFRSYAFLPHSLSESGSDIPSGFHTAYVWWPLKNDGTVRTDNDPTTLLHEAIGHCFAGLADEYVEDEWKWDDYDSHKEDVMKEQKNGYCRNISMDSDVTKTYWADFAADSRYDFEKLGCYEGGEYQATGVYRATEISIMRDTFGSSYFNVIARVMIYKRCMKIAYGDSWQFDYEDFVKFDLEKAKAEYKANQKLDPIFSTSKRFCAPPQFVKMKASR